MTPYSRRIAFGVVALAAMAAFARYAVERTRGADGASWKPVAVLAWACLWVVAVAVVAAATVLGVGEVRGVRERRAAWRGRPVPGEEGSTRPAESTDLPMAVRATRSWYDEEREWLLANGWRPGGVTRPRHAAPPATAEIPVVETTAEIVRPDDGVPDHWKPPVSPPAEDVPPSQREYTDGPGLTVVQLHGPAGQLASPAAWDLWSWERAA